MTVELIQNSNGDVTAKDSNPKAQWSEPPRFTQEQKMAAFASQFPCLNGKPGVSPWRPLVLQRWATTVASSGERHCAVFCLNVWNPYHRWRAGRFNLMDAVGVLDGSNRAVMLRWIANPWWP